MIKTKNAGVQRAKYVIQEMSLTEAMRDALESYRKRKLDRKSEDAYVYDQGKEAGEQIGMERGIEQGIEQGKQDVLLDLVQQGKLDVETAAETCGITPKEFHFSYSRNRIFYDRMVSGGICRAVEKCKKPHQRSCRSRSCGDDSDSLLEKKYNH